MKSIRFPAVSGLFYPSSKDSLIKQIENCFLSHIGPGSLPRLNPKGKREIVALVVPHAGYMYSGPVAAHSYFSLAEDGKPEIIVILGPNHTGIGSGVSIMISGKWRTPLGDVEIDEDTAKTIVEKSKFVDIDELAHTHEHSIEVQLPFLQYVLRDFKFVPICMMMQDLRTSRDVGEAIASSIKDKNAIIIASTDLTHYEDQKSASIKDRSVIESILSLDEEKLERIITEMNVSMCGPGPVATAIYAAKLLGAKSAYLLKYATSGDITGDYSSVVGYTSIKIVK